MQPYSHRITPFLSDFLPVFPTSLHFPSEHQIPTSLFIKLNFLSIQIQLKMFHMIFDIPGIFLAAYSVALILALAPKATVLDGEADLKANG